MIALSSTNRIRILLLTFITVLSLLVLPSCNKQEPEKVDIQTTLSLSDSFSGKRTIVMTFPQSVIKTGSDSETELEKVVQKYCPNALTPSKGYVDGKVQYSFELAFNSRQEYIEKTSEILGSQAMVSFSHPNTVMTKGWKIEENFQSKSLLTDWIANGADSEGFGGLDLDTDETKTTVFLNDDAQTSPPVISVNCLDGYPIQKIHIETIKKKGNYDNSVTYYDRTVVFTVSQSTYESDSTKIDDYFASVTPSAAKSERPFSNNSYNYTIVFKDLSQTELRSYTQKLLHTEYGEVDYLDKDAGSTVLAEQNSYNEELDFSNYIGNNGTNVPIEYVYSVSGTTELGECQLYEDGTWRIADDFLDNNQYGKVSAIKYDGSYMKLRINDGKQYTANSIEIEAVPLEGDNLRKTITFKFDKGAAGDEASDYAKSYIESLGYGALKEFIDTGYICTYTSSGTPDTLNETFTKILSGKNTYKLSSEGKFMTLRTLKQYTEHLDLSSVILGKNSETPVYYKLSAQGGDIVKAFSYNSAEGSEQADLSKIKDGSVSMQIKGTKIDLLYNVTSPNVSDIIFFSVISGIIVLISIAMIFILKGKKLPAAALGGGSRGTGLPGSDSKLATRTKKTSLNKKK